MSSSFDSKEFNSFPIYVYFSLDKDINTPEYVNPAWEHGGKEKLLEAFRKEYKDDLCNPDLDTEPNMYGQILELEHKIVERFHRSHEWLLAYAISSKTFNPCKFTHETKSIYLQTKDEYSTYKRRLDDPNITSNGLVQKQPSTFTIVYQYDDIKNAELIPVFMGIVQANETIQQVVIRTSSFENGLLEIVEYDLRYIKVQKLSLKYQANNITVPSITLAPLIVNMKTITINPKTEVIKSFNSSTLDFKFPLRTIKSPANNALVNETYDSDLHVTQLYVQIEEGIEAYRRLSVRQGLGFTVQLLKKLIAERIGIDNNNIDSLFMHDNPHDPITDKTIIFNHSRINISLK
ncbi:hypothetical protein DFA_05929 [Cavenderia fasciculata]|uniref:Uncharacterized protein n=1 Tax=Cavenderia fasciculata TaxID=261658 RepID=F4PJL9_CACFS|nr:uncharacterized protein DFA_05929 [Cavenderia fasciculata]EGG23793.1 hypothetical protein DFA_05929 [Cavenderia fasciculata]|eukprot:XP_004361644.1 hypothetical protein DFA_05929 [Cavenderia fasciculata]